MNIFIHNTEAKAENPNLEAFLQDYIPNYLGSEFEEVNVQCPDEQIRESKAPDYYVPEIETSIEIKQVLDRLELEEHVIWARTVKRLDEALEGFDLTKIEGSYLINTPYTLRVKNGQEARVDEILLKAVEEGETEVEINGHSIEIWKLNDTGSSIGFGGFSGVKTVDPVGTISINVDRPLKKADMQLLTQSGRNKILLLINKYTFGNEAANYFTMLSSYWDDLGSKYSFDQIWVQQASTGSITGHELLWTREFHVSFESEDSDSIENELFQKWLKPLKELDGNKNEKIFRILQAKLADNAPHTIFYDKYAREEMVRLGNWLAEEKRLDDLVWLVSKFINDPDPPEPGSVISTDDLANHLKVYEGGDPLIITTVLGHLAWVIKHLTKDENYISSALDFTCMLLEHKNLYVKQQAIVPLMEIAWRRGFLDGSDRRPRESEYLKFHGVVFNLVELVTKNPRLYVISKWLTNVFAFYKDLDTNEAIQVWEAIKHAHDANKILMYYSIFREKHFTDLDIEFDRKPFREILKKKILSENIEDENEKFIILINLRKLLEDKPEEFENLREWLDLFSGLPLNNLIFRQMIHIIRMFIDTHTEICLVWLKNILKSADDAVEEQGGGIFLSFALNIIEYLDEKEPDEARVIREELQSLKDKGARVYESHYGDMQE